MKQEKSEVIMAEQKNKEYEDKFVELEPVNLTGIETSFTF